MANIPSFQQVLHDISDPGLLKRYRPPRISKDTFATQQAFLDSLTPIPIETVEAENRKCAYCFKPYGDSDPGHDNAEQPVKFACGHIFGEKCMKEHLFRIPDFKKVRLVPFSFEPGSPSASLGRSLDEYYQTSHYDDDDKVAFFIDLLEGLHSYSAGLPPIDSKWRSILALVLRCPEKLLNIHFLDNAVVMDIEPSRRTYPTFVPLALAPELYSGASALSAGPVPDGWEESFYGDATVNSDLSGDSKSLFGPGQFTPQENSSIENPTQATKGGEGAVPALTSPPIITASGLPIVSSDMGSPSAKLAAGPGKNPPSSSKLVLPPIGGPSTIASYPQGYPTSFLPGGQVPQPAGQASNTGLINAKMHNSQLKLDNNSTSASLVSEQTPTVPAVSESSWKAALAGITKLDKLLLKVKGQKSPKHPSENPFDGQHGGNRSSRYARSSVEKEKEKHIIEILSMALNHIHEKYTEAGLSPSPLKKRKLDFTEHTTPMHTIQVAAVVHKHELTAKSLKLPQAPRLVSGYGYNGEDEENEDSSESESEGEGEDVSSVNNFFVVYRSLCPGCYNHQRVDCKDAGRKMASTTPECLQWDDCSKAPDGCPICRKILFKRQYQSTPPRCS